ncbi:MAG: hypothetical protein JRG93_21260 [Deltaproteobacteria bacterium]|nr:hypothetical protein [Deltaproteobacteria bacterium]
MKRLFLLVMTSVMLAGCGDSGAVGGSCTTAEDCGAGLCIVNGSFPDGLCTPACDVDDECPEGPARKNVKRCAVTHGSAARSRYRKAEATGSYASATDPHRLMALERLG